MSTPPLPPILGRGDEAGIPATTDRPQRGSVTSLLILSLFIFLMTNNGGNDDPTVRNHYKDNLSSLEWQLGNYSAWLNGSDTTNFTMPTRPPGEYRIVSEAVPHRGVLDPLTQSYYSNITGFVRGNVSFRNLSSELTEVAEKLGRWNWSATNKVTMSLLSRPVDVDEKEKEEFEGVAMLHGHIEVIDGNSARELQLDFAGVQFLETGSLYGLAQDSGISIDIRALPSLVPPGQLNITARAVVPVIEDNITKLKALLGSNDLPSEANPTSQDSICKFACMRRCIQMRELEEELLHPTGITTVPRPPLKLDVAIISPDCGVLIEAKDANGMRSRIFFRKVTAYAGFAGLVYLVMLLLLSQQMSESRSPAALSRISRWSEHNTPLSSQRSPTQEMTWLSLIRSALRFIWYDEHNRIWYFVLIVLVLVVRVVVAPGLAAILLAVLYSSIWAPQIVRAARRGRPCALGMKYIVGTTVGRMLLALYVLGCPKNVMDVEPRPWVYLLLLIACTQVAVLGLQTSFGPAFFLPQRLADSQGYDYHPPLPDTEDRPPEDASGKPGRRGARTRASYSLAPCAHLFHTDCLERNICPQCRRPLPPL
ncbi:hypothetical protein BJV77DRAFT_1013954 [Russula vinacea]|nr:hypothetical protein BJV77DRAFT_1013954 [Russula vinacea]